MKYLLHTLFLSIISYALIQGIGGKEGIGGKAGIGGGTSSGVTINCGITSTATGSDSNAAHPQASPCTTGADGLGYTVNSISWYAQAATNNQFDLGIYTDSSGPNTLVCHTGNFSVTTTIGFNTHSIAGCGTLTGNTNYWVGWISDSTYGFVTGSLSKIGPVQGSEVLPTPFGTVSFLGESQSLYVTLTPN